MGRKHEDVLAGGAGAPDPAVPPHRGPRRPRRTGVGALRRQPQDSPGGPLARLLARHLPGGGAPLRRQLTHQTAP